MTFMLKTDTITHYIFIVLTIMRKRVHENTVICK